MGLDINLTVSRFELLAGTAIADLVGEVISGSFGYGPLVITNTARVCEEVANWPDSPLHILRFTRKYGPLHTYTRAGERFEFDLSEWSAFRKTFRNNWVSVFSAPRE